MESTLLGIARRTTASYDQVKELSKYVSLNALEDTVRGIAASGSTIGQYIAYRTLAAKLNDSEQGGQ